MEVVEPVAAMQDICKRLVGERVSIRFVPTMGSLHDGHGSLIRHALSDRDDYGDGDEGEADDSLARVSASCACKTNANGSKPPTSFNEPLDQANVVANDTLSAGQKQQRGGSASGVRRHRNSKRVVIVSIFINPTQFNDRNDYVNYPKTVEPDLELCDRLGVDYVFVPSCDDIYRPNRESQGSQSTSVAEIADKRLAALTTSERCLIKPPNKLVRDLEGKSRKNYFVGMLTVVCKLFNIIQPERAYFGEKDYQQLVLIKKMVEDLNIPVKICPVETVRLPIINLALSSRNVHLNKEQQRLAAQMTYDLMMNTKQELEENCRRQTGCDISKGSCLDLESILVGSLLSSQLCVNLHEDDVTDHHYRDNSSFRHKQTTSIDTDYFELRCAKDLSMINYDHSLTVFDCEQGCVRRKLSFKHYFIDDDDSNNSRYILRARLLIAVLVSNVRLLDNISVQLNLS